MDDVEQRRLSNLKRLRFGPQPKTIGSREAIVEIDGVSLSDEEIDEPRTGDHALMYKVTESQFARLCRSVSVESLFLKNVQVESLSDLRHINGLKHLLINYNRNLSSLDSLEDVPPLETLILQSVRHVHDLGPLAFQPGLEALEIAGSMGSLTPDAVINTLAPVAELTNLRELSLINARVSVGGLRPLAKCSSLESLSLPNTFETSDYAYLSVALPNTRCDSLAPLVKFDSPIPGTDKDVLIVGRRKPFLNSRRDAEKIARYVRAFEKLADVARDSLS